MGFSMDRERGKLPHSRPEKDEKIHHMASHDRHGADFRLPALFSDNVS